MPLTADGRLSAKEIIGNRKNLVKWQDEFWQHMVKQYPELERSESASQTGREHIPPRIFKEMTQLTKRARPATHRTGFFAIKQAVNRHKTAPPGIRHKARCKAHGKAFFEPQGTNKAHSSRFRVIVKQEIPRFTPCFQRSIVGFYLVRWKGLEPPAY